ncbi:MAG: hypothetical protein KGI68_04340 [Alphaproteobacteria bacterium]|nr:hypothetical protein [Alphaproteobacteria bacterium]MDE2500557.1 hypothetical protein [Alphaproteobacteria bacterium]
MDMGDGYWVKIEARKVEPSEGRPHGIDYSLCLFSPDDDRLVCFDNAHPVSSGSGSGSGPARKRSGTNDHVHRGVRIRPYGYTDAEQLMEDFWCAVEETLRMRGVQP